MNTADSNLYSLGAYVLLTHHSKQSQKVASIITRNMQHLKMKIPFSPTRLAKIFDKNNTQQGWPKGVGKQIL